MYIFRHKKDLRKYLGSLKAKHLKTGFVPTMGALHQGHLSLIEKATTETDRVICSIFINPTQFNDREDLKKYPVETHSDIQKLLDSPTDVLFLPDTSEMYPNGLHHLEHYDFGRIETLAEGAHRPGHFQGVGQVLSRLLKIIEPDKMFMGQKDYQQVLIARKLVMLMERKIEIVAAPIKREIDGLAMSSRNVRLSDENRKVAPQLNKTLYLVFKNLGKVPLADLLGKAVKQLELKGFRVEYLMLANAKNLNPVEEFTPAEPLVLLVAAWLNGIRLIDNLLVNSILL